MQISIFRDYEFCCFSVLPVALVPTHSGFCPRSIVYKYIILNTRPNPMTNLPQHSAKDDLYIL